MLNCGCDCVVVQVCSGECRLDGFGAICFNAHASHANAGGLARAIVIQVKMNSDSNDSKSRSRMRHLLISLAKASARFLDANFAEYLARLKISRQQIDKEVFGFDGALAVWSN